MKPKTVYRIVRPTALIYCEGAHDLIFVRLLKSFYAGDNPPSRPNISVRKGRGGSAYGLVEDAARLDGFDQKLVKLDNDRPSNEISKAKAIAAKKGITLAISTPCLESLLLVILQPGKDYTRWSSNRCKREFETKYVPRDKRTIPKAYRRYFTKTKINVARSNSQELDELISFIEQK